MAALLLCMIILLPGETNLLQGQTEKGILLGFEGDNIYYRVWIPQDHKVIRSTNGTLDWRRGACRYSSGTEGSPNDGWAAGVAAGAAAGVVAGLQPRPG